MSGGVELRTQSSVAPKPVLSFCLIPCLSTCRLNTGAMVFCQGIRAQPSSDL